MRAATPDSATAKFRRPIKNIRSGAMTTPPRLAPLSAKLMARPRRLSNQGAMMILIAAPLIAAQPHDITANAA